MIKTGVPYWHLWIRGMIRLRNPLAAVLICLAVLAAFEIAIRVLRPTPPLPDYRHIGWNALTSLYRWAPSADPGYVKNPAAEVNQLILRGRPFTRGASDKIRVLLIGDSQVEAAALPFADMPELLLERILNEEHGGERFEVRSIAAGGWGQAQQLVALREYYSKYSAEYVLLWHTPGNDFWENAFPDRSTSGQLGLLKPTFVLAPDGLKQFDFAPYQGEVLPLLSYFHLYRRVYRMVESAGLLGQPRVLHDFYKLIPEPKGHITSARENCPATLVDLGTYGRDRPKYASTPVSIETNEAFLESRSHFAPFLNQLSDRDRYLVTITEALFREIDLLAQAHNSKLIVFFNSQSYRDGGNHLFPGSCVVQSGQWYELADIAERVRATLAEFNPIELTTAHAEISLNDVHISERDRHLNRLGNELLLRELVARLGQSGSLSRPAPSRHPQGSNRSPE